MIARPLDWLERIKQQVPETPRIISTFGRTFPRPGRPPKPKANA